jgi:hypothetical protein
MPGLDEIARRFIKEYLIWWPPIRVRGECRQSGADWRNYNRSLCSHYWTADPDERRARETHSLIELAVPETVRQRLLALIGHFPRRSNLYSSTLIHITRRWKHVTGHGGPVIRVVAMRQANCDLVDMGSIL